MLKYGLTELYSNIFCFSTTRHGGYSEGAYATFNCNAYCGDACDAVRKNCGLLCSLLPEGAGLLIPHQVHGTEVRVIDEAFLRKPESEKARLLEGVDALVSDVPKACLCISTADCIPVLCYDVRRRAIAAIHAGWRGTVSRIVSKTLEKMRQVYGTEGKDVCACIGPGISQEAFEVGDEVCEAFRRAGFDMERIAVRKRTVAVAHRHGAYSHIRAFESRAYGTAVYDVATHVGAFVNARYYQIGQPVLHKVQGCQFDAVGGRTVHGYAQTAAARIEFAIT